MVNLGETAKETIGALKGQPLLLVVVILNVLMLAMIGWSVREAQGNHRAILQLALERCLPGVK